mgnify:FL=1
MKKAFSLKKKLPKVLAVALAAACFAGAVPANAAGNTYAYSTIGSYGSFEEYMWYLCDNVKGDKVTFTTVDGVAGIPVVTKGANEAAADWASLATRNMMFAAGGKYQVSFAIKSTDASGWFKLSGKKFSEDLATHGDIVYNSASVDGAAAAEAYVSNEWKNVVAEFTVDGTKPVNQFRIYLRGNAGTQLTIKDFDVKAIEEKVKTRDVVSLDAWEGSYKDGTEYTDSYIEALADGYKEPGSIHFYQKNGDGNKADLNIYYVLSGLTVGQTYTLKFAIKGDSLQISWAVPTNIELAYSNNSTWAGTEESVLKLTENYSEWQELSYDFTANHNSMQIRFNSSKYGRHDFQIDNIKVYAKDDASETNLIANGNFYATEPATTLDGWEGSYKDGTEYTDSYIEALADGYKDPGSIHFYQKNGDGNKADRNIYYVLSGLTVGQTYTLKFAIKGDSLQISWAVPTNIELAFSNNSTWVGTEESVLKLTENYSEWQELSYDFTANHNSMQIRFNSSKYGRHDFQIDNIKVYAKNDESKTNLIANGDFCEKEAVVSDSSAIDNSPYKVNNVPGFDIGMLNDVLGGDKDISVVPGGSYDGSAAVEIRGGDSAERYFQQLDTDAVKFVLGDTAVKATGYFKVTAGNTEPKIWLGFGKSYGGGNSVGLHFANYLKNGKADSGESFTARDDGWYYFEKTVDTGTFNNKINSMTELVWVKYMCGIDARTNTGAARFDNITCEIISSAEPGDANNDGEINILDMVRMKKYSAGNESFENITRGMWLTENTDGAAALAALKKVIIGASSEYGK